MSERLEPAEVPEAVPEAEAWATGEHYSRMNIEAGTLGNAYYFGIPAFTILTQTEEQLNEINEKFSKLFSEYTDAIIVGKPHEASLIISLNQAALDLNWKDEVINTLRAKIFELGGNEEDAGNWDDALEGDGGK